MNKINIRAVNTLRPGDIVTTAGWGYTSEVIN